ncbi:hypothetical protein FNV43_RR26766 [Rhamnella rubrinervis]|uniref:BZIP domain-containing protein n=1 Tax=Rhamnella rubrinervis TaxID=2594499 RepID=A0A8K0GJY6_9ROSA|nr:hypothetical protein FNV43_RR26766 [Rhamnella rubrinervis]
MLPGEFTGLHYLSPENPISIPANFGMFQNDNMPTLHFNTFLTNLPNSHIGFPPAAGAGHEFGTTTPTNTTPQSSSLSNNSTSDEAEEQQLRIIDERRQRRMISNRESARRSRMRKQKHLDELWSQVVRLRTENHSLIDKLHHMSECHDKVVKENARLKEEASDLRQMITDFQIGSPYNNTTTALRDLEEVPCNTAHLRAELSSNLSITNSVDLLH